MTDKTRKDNGNGKKGREWQGEHDTGQECSAAASGAVQRGMALSPGGSGAFVQPTGISAWFHLIVSIN